MKKAFVCLLSICPLAMTSTEVAVFSEPHGYKESAFTLQMSSATPETSIYYTTDCTTPTMQNGILYSGPLTISHTATIRAVAIDADGNCSDLTAASYIFPNDVLSQSNTPAGYPDMWGPYCSIDGTAIADYGMDSEVIETQQDADNVKQALLSLPVLSIITDPGNLFSHDMDEETGGIYIYTGGDASSTGNGYGDDWLRAASIEFWESDDTNEHYYAPQNDPSGFQVNCAIKIHGNASRQAEKTPKHSFRMKMKGSYGPKKLNYRLFGEEGGKKFNQIVIRAGFGNTWLHWLPGQQKQAMYTRDAWAKRMMQRLGYLASGTRYAHLYLNGMYWGIYNPTERVDADFCELHFGYDADDYDVVRCDDGLNTVDGSLDDYQRLLSQVEQCDSYATYQALRGLDVDGKALTEGDVLLDTDNFIDYMLMNYYGGNSDWDHHNWVAVHQHGAKEGFIWIPWDSELVLQGVNDNATGTYNKDCPTYILQTLMEKSSAFRIQFADRAFYALCEEFGWLSPDSAQTVWEELTAEINQAMYAESARWGDYRRDVHPYIARGELYTKQNYFDPQCDYMRNIYFPQRTAIVAKQLQNAGLWSLANDAPKLLVDEAVVKTVSVTLDANVKSVTLNGSSTVYYTLDGSDPLTFNDSGNPKIGETATRYTGALDIKEDCVLKARIRSGAKSWGPLLVRNIKVDGLNSIDFIESNIVSTDAIYNLMGQPVANPTKGIYIKNGKKFIVN